MSRHVVPLATIATLDMTNAPAGMECWDLCCQYVTLSEDPELLDHHIKLANTKKGLHNDQDPIASPTNASDAKQAQFTVK